MVAYDFGVGQFFSGAIGQLYPSGDSFNLWDKSKLFPKRGPTSIMRISYAKNILIYKPLNYRTPKGGI